MRGQALADSTRKYYGRQERDRCEIVAHEGRSSRISTGLYGVQYATPSGLVRARGARSLGGSRNQRYLTFLGSGGSGYPIDLLKAAGVDMTTDEPLELTMKKMNRVMDEMEKLLGGSTAGPGR